MDLKLRSSADPLESNRGSSQETFEIPPNLSKTLGIEIELFMVYKSDALEKIPAHYEKVYSAAHLLALILRENEVDVDHYRLGRGRSRTWDEWIVHGEALALKMNEAKAAPWGYIGEAIELSSRKFRFQKDDWAQEVSNVVRVIKILSELGFYAFTNEDCGLHVHVGSIPSQSIPKLTKDLLMLTTAFERCIDEIHTVRRISELPADQRFCNPWSFGFRQSSEIQDPFLVSWIRRIEDEEQIFQLLNDLIATDETRSYLSRNFAYNLCTLNQSYLEDPSNTIEFRQHEGTLDETEIIAWATFVVELCGFCQTVSHQRLKSLLMENIQNRDFRLEQLLQAIGASQTVSTRFSQRIPANDTSVLELNRAIWWREGEFTYKDLPADLHKFAHVLKANAKEVSHPGRVARAIDRKHLRKDYGEWVEPNLLSMANNGSGKSTDPLPKVLISAEHGEEWHSQTCAQNKVEVSPVTSRPREEQKPRIVEKVRLSRDQFSLLDDDDFEDIRTSSLTPIYRQAPSF